MTINETMALDVVRAGGVTQVANLPEGNATIVGFSPWRNVNIGVSGKNASTKKARWVDYYDMYRQHAIVRAAIDTLSDSATNTTYDFVPRDTRSKARSREVKALKDFFSTQPDFSHEVNKVAKDLLIYGDSYLYIVPDRRRRPVRLKHIHPKTITVNVDSHGRIINYYQKNPDDPHSELIIFGPNEFIHFKIPDPDNDVYGLSPLESLRMAVATDLYAQRFNGAYFKNSAVTGTIITIKSADPADIERNRKYLTENYTGPDSAHKPLVLQGETVDVKKMVNTHHDMAFLEGRRMIMTEILAVLKVPPTKIGITQSANRSNSKEQDKSFRSESVAPLQKLIEDTINNQFVRTILGIEDTIIVHADGDVRDATDQMALWQIGEKMGVYTINEIRAKLGMADIPGGDIAYIMGPTGAVPVAEMPLYSIIPKVQTGQMNMDHPGGANTQTALVAQDKKPARTVDDASSMRGTATKKTLTPSHALFGVVTHLEKAYESDEALRQAYAYMNDLLDTTDDPRLELANHALQKACGTNDQLLRTAYLERASANITNLLERQEEEEEKDEDDE